MKHLGVLRDARLIQTLPRGRPRCHFRVERALGPAASWLEAATGPADAATGPASAGRVSPPESR